MNHFCQQCGNKLGEGERFCGACGTPVPQPQSMQQPVPQPQPQPVQQPVPQPAYPQPEYPDYAQLVKHSEQQPSGKKEKKPINKKKWIIIGSVAGAVAILAAVFFIFIFPLFSGGNDASLIAFSNGGNDYYASPYLFKLNGSNAPDIVEHQGDERSGKCGWIYFARSAKSGDTVYMVEPNNGWEKSLIKMKFTSGTTVTESEWVSIDTIKSSPFYNSKDENIQPAFRCMYHLQADGNYVYFNVRLDKEYAAAHGEVRGKVGRISLDGSTIEQVGDINAADFVVDGGWIYYFDEGFYYEEGGRTAGQRHSTGVGIYKVKTDGSGKKLLREFTIPSDMSDQYENNVNSCLCGRMQMIGGKLYYLDYSAEGMGRLCRMDKNGGGVDYLSASPAAYYAIDTDHNAAYYSIAEYDANYGFEENSQSIEPKFAKFDIASHAEIRLPFVGYNAYGVDYQKGYLYFCSANFQMVALKSAGDQKCGLRMNVGTGTYEWLIYSDESTEGWVTDPKTGRPKSFEVQEGEHSLRWETAQTR